MAEEKGTQKPKERVKYKFGQNDIDLTNYIHNLGTNVQSYLNSKNWNEGQKQEFMNAYSRYLTGLQEQLANNTNRFTTDDFGSIIDSTGALSNTDDDNIDPVGSEYYYDNKGNRITTDDFNLLGKRKQKKYNIFSANREVATYFNTIGNALKDMETPKEKAQDAFDLSKHGFSADWTKTNNPAGGDFNLDPYLEKDTMDETTGKRGTSNRAAYLKEQIENYINNIGEYDFSSSPFKTRDDYIQRLQEAAAGLDNGYNSEDTIALNRAGISGDFLNKFFATGEAPKQKSDLKLQAEQAAKEKQEREKNQELQQIIDSNEQEKYNLERNTYLNNWIKENPFTSTINNNITPFYNYDETAKEIISRYPNVNLEDAEQRRQIMRRHVNFPELVASYIRGNQKVTGVYGDDKGKDITSQYIARNLDLAYQEGLFNDSRYLTQDNKSIMGDSGFIVVPDSEDYSRYSFIGYNPVTRQYKEFSMLQNPDLSKEINALLRERMAYNAYDKNIQKKEKGGILKFQIGGQGALRHIEQYKKAREAKEARDKRVQENAVKNDRTIEEQEKYENDSKLQWSDADKLRLGAIFGDVTSLIASMTGVGSVASAAIGAASTAANQAADMKEGMGFWESLGNNAVSYGLDALSVLPFAKSAKVPRMVKAIADFTPKLMAGISTIQGLANGEEILKSLKKVKDGESLTVGDWKNISQGLQIVLGGGAAFNRARAANKRLNAAKTDSEYVKTNQGTVKLSAEQMKKLRTANTLEEQNKVLKELGVTLEGKQTGMFWNRKTSDEAVDIPENFVYDLSKPVTLHSGDLQYQYKFGPGEKWLGTGTIPSLNIPAVRNVYNRVIHPQAYNRAKSKVTETPKTTETPKKNKTKKPSIKTNKTKPFSEKIKTKVQFLSDLFFSKQGGTLNLSKVRKFQSGSSVTGIKYKPAQPKQDSKINFLSDLGNNPTIQYGLPRAVFADQFNKKIIDKTFLKPLLLEPFEFNRYVRSDLDAEMQGERNYADLRRLASRPITSDGNLQTAAQFQSELQGQEARTAGKEKSNQVQRQYDELAQQQEERNAANRHETAMFNREKQLEADKTKNVFEQAYLSKKSTIWDVLGQQLEYDARTKQKENKALEDNFVKSDIHNAISYAPNDYGANLTPDELTVWNKVLSGTNPSSLSSQEFNSYKLAAQKVSRVKTEQLRQYYNVPNTIWSGKTPSTPWSPTISKAISAKNGAKIAVAGIEAKTADAERFQKQIKECIDRNEKAIDRLSKSLYGLIKASRIK